MFKLRKLHCSLFHQKKWWLRREEGYKCWKCKTLFTNREGGHLKLAWCKIFHIGSWYNKNNEEVHRCTQCDAIHPFTEEEIQLKRRYMK